MTYRKKLKPHNVRGHLLIKNEVKPHKTLTRVHNVNDCMAILEKLDGVDLFDYANSADRSVVQIYSVLQQVWDALQHMHQCGVVHCDVKPENVRVLPNGNAKLFDFGAVRRIGETVVEFTRTYTDARYWTNKFYPPAAHPAMDTHAFCITCISVLFCLNAPETLDTPCINVWIEQYILKSLLSKQEIKYAFASNGNLAKVRYALNHNVSIYQTSKGDSALHANVAKKALGHLGLSVPQVHALFSLSDSEIGVWLGTALQNAKRHGLSSKTCNPGKTEASIVSPARKRQRK